MNIFEMALAAGDVAIDAVMGETEGFTFIPIKSAGDVNARRISDPDRLSFDIVAPFSDPVRTDDGDAIGRTTTAPQLEPMKALFPQGVRNYDRIRRLRTGVLYQVVDIRPDTLDKRLTLLLQEYRE